MKYFEIDITRPFNDKIRLGKVGENGILTVAFNITSIEQEFGPGTVTLKFKPNAHADSIEKILPVTNSRAIWKITKADTCAVGVGEAGLIFTFDNSQVKKTRVYKTQIEDAVITPDEYKNIIS